jgi:hypothetical protein
VSGPDSPGRDRSGDAPAQEQSLAADALLNLQRLDSFRRLGMLDELLDDYVPELARLVALLDAAAGIRDLQGTLDALHSLLGMSGEAGALALYQQVRKVYVPLVEQGRWPGGEWVEGIRSLANTTELALRDYCAADTRAGTD